MSVVDDDDIVYEDDPPHPRRSENSYHGGTSSREKKYVDWLVMSLIGALCWVVYNIKETQSAHGQSIAVLQTLMTAQAQQSKESTDYIHRRIDSVEGRTLRGAAHELGLDNVADKP